MRLLRLLLLLFPCVQQCVSGIPWWPSRRREGSQASPLPPRAALHILELPQLALDSIQRHLPVRDQLQWALSSKHFHVFPFAPSDAFRLAIRHHCGVALEQAWLRAYFRGSPLDLSPTISAHNVNPTNKEPHLWDSFFHVPCLDALSQFCQADDRRRSTTTIHRSESMQIRIEGRLPVEYAHRVSMYYRNCATEWNLVVWSKQEERAVETMLTNPLLPFRFHLTSTRAHPESIAQLLQRHPDWTTLRSVRVASSSSSSSSSSDNDPLLALFQSLHNNARVDRVDLSRVTGDRGRIAEEVAKAFAYDIAVPHWTLFCYVVSWHALLLSAGLRRNQSIRSLELAYQDRDTHGLVVLLDALRKHPSLTSLHIWSSEMDGDVVQTLATVVLQSQSLRQLTVRGRAQVSTWMEPLVEALLHRPDALTHLRMDGCLLDEPSVSTLARALEHPQSTLVHLDVSYTGLTLSGLRSLARGLAKNTRLEELVMSENMFGQQYSAYVVAVLLAQNRGLVRLRMSAIHLHAKFAHAFVGALASNPRSKLQQLQLDGTQRDRKHLEQLSDAFQRMAGTSSSARLQVELRENHGATTIPSRWTLRIHIFKQQEGKP